MTDLRARGKETRTATARERFRAALERRTADRVPIDYLAHPAFDARLRERLGAATERELLDALGADFFYLPGRDISQNEGFLPFYRKRLPAPTESERVCPLGIRWRRGAGASKFAVDEALEGPLEKARTPREILDHPWPRARDFDFSPLRDIADANADRARIGGLWTGILGDSYRMIGFQRFLTDVAMDPDFVHALVDRMTEMYLELNAAVFEALGDRLEVWFFGNDFGSQDGLLFSRAMWEDYFLDNIRRLTRLARKAGLTVTMHSCGSVASLIPALAEAGVDILDPVQTSARGMDPATLKREHGERMVFHGGADTQDVLRRADAEGARRHARELIDELGRGGGYIFAPSQILQTDIPVENALAIYEEARRSGGGALSKEESNT